MGNRVDGDGHGEALRKAGLPPGNTQRISEQTPTSGGVGGSLHNSDNSVLFTCPKCARQCFDGNMPKTVACICGEFWLRDDFGIVMRAPPKESEGDFLEEFDQCTTQFQGVLKDLEIAIFGVFSRRNSDDFGDSRIRAQSEVANLREFFNVRKRFLGEGERFQYMGKRYKVLSTVPAQGFVGSRTSISCPMVLGTQEATSVHLAAIHPHVLTQDLQQALILPFFESPRHLHASQLLNLKGLECLVLQMSPSDGLVTSSTVLTFESTPLTVLKTLRLTPYLEDLPTEIQRLDRLSNMKAVFARYITPFFKGWRRVVAHGETVTIRGAQFRVSLARPTRGVVTETTTILYHGRAASRRQEMEKQMQQDEALARSLQMELEPRVARMQRLSRSRETRDMLLQVIEMLHVIRVSGDAEGASQLEIDILPTHAYAKTAESEHCLICLCEFQEEESVRTLPCFHYFHNDCIDKWLPSNKACPVCKTPATYRSEDSPN